MLRSLAVLVLLLSLAAATPVVCLCMPTEQGYQPLRDLAGASSPGDVSSDESPAISRLANLARRPSAPHPIGAAVAALTLIATAVAPSLAGSVMLTVPAVRRLLPRPLPLLLGGALPPPAPPPRGLA